VRIIKKEEESDRVACSIVFNALLAVLIVNCIRQFAHLFIAYPKTGNSFVLAGEGVIKMHLYP